MFPFQRNMDNPWLVESVWAFSYLHCPECAFNAQEESAFQHHAIETHPLSFVLFQNDFQQELFVKEEPKEECDELFDNNEEMFDESFENDKEFCEDPNQLATKGPKKYLTLAEKLEIVNLYENGMKFGKIGKAKGMPYSSVRAICQRKEAIKVQGVSASSNKILLTRTRTMEQLEKLLSSWIFDLEQKGTPAGQSEVQAKARSLFLQIKENLEDKTEKEIKETFIASNGWFANFKKRNEAQGEICGIDEIKEDIMLPSNPYYDFLTKQEINEPSVDNEEFFQDPNPEITRPKKSVSLAEKLEIIKLFENGASYSKIGRAKELPFSTVRTICKKKDKYNAQATSSNFQFSNAVFKARTRTMQEMENHLSSWISEKTLKGNELTNAKIQKKAKCLFILIKDSLEDKTEAEIKETFKASNGWFHMFTKRNKMKISAKDYNADEIKEDICLPSTSQNDITIKHELIEPLPEVVEVDEPKEEIIETQIQRPNKIKPSLKRKRNKKPSLKPSEPSEQQKLSKVPKKLKQILVLDTDSDNEQPAVKKPKKYLTLAEKLEVIELHESGLKFSQVGDAKGMSESSVRGICKKKEKYKAQSAQGVSGNNLKFNLRSRTMERMEELLSSWIIDVEQRGISIKKSQIQAKARSLFLHIKNNLEDKTEDEIKETFEASNGWIHKFNKRQKVHSATKSSEGSANVDPLDIMTCYQLPDSNDFVCDLCGFSTFSNAKLKQHRYEKHETEKHKPCPYCAYKSPSNDCINRHIDRLHPEHGEKNFTCDTCGKGFIYKTSFHEHKWFYCPMNPEYKARNSGQTSARSKPSGSGLLTVEALLARTLRKS